MWSIDLSISTLHYSVIKKARYLQVGNISDLKILNKCFGNLISNARELGSHFTELNLLVLGNNKKKAVKKIECLSILPVCVYLFESMCLGNIKYAFHYSFEIKWLGNTMQAFYHAFEKRYLGNTMYIWRYRLKVRVWVTQCMHSTTHLKGLVLAPLCISDGTRLKVRVLVPLCMHSTTHLKVLVLVPLCISEGTRLKVRVLVTQCMHSNNHLKVLVLAPLCLSEETRLKVSIFVK